MRNILSCSTILMLMLFAACEKQIEDVLSNRNGEVHIEIRHSQAHLQTEELQVQLYPHPFSERISITIHGDFNSGLLNKPERNGGLSQMVINDTNESMYLDFSDYSEGFYYLEIKLDDNIYRYRILKI